MESHPFFSNGSSSRNDDRSSYNWEHPPPLRSTSDEIIDFLMDNPRFIDEDLNRQDQLSCWEQDNRVYEVAHLHDSLSYPDLGRNKNSDNLEDWADPEMVRQQHMIAQQIAMERIQKSHSTRPPLKFEQYPQPQEFLSYEKLPSTSIGAPSAPMFVANLDPEMVRQQHMIVEQIAMEQIRKSHPTPPLFCHGKTYGTLVGVPSLPRSMTLAISDCNLTRNGNTDDETKTSSPTRVPPQPKTAVQEQNEEEDIEKERVELAEQRVLQGQCPLCGQQLFQLAKDPKWKKMIQFSFQFGSAKDRKREGEQLTHVHNKNKNNISTGTACSQQGHLLRMKPLDIAGLVHRGQCIRCSKKDKDPEAFASNVFLKDEEFQGLDYLEGSILHPLVLPNKSEKNSNTVADLAGPCVAKYTGPLDEQGQRHGIGILKWSNGDIYRGHFEHGIRQGPGTLTFHDSGGEYVGDWKNNQMDGSGTRRFANGDLYTGPYEQGQRSGSNGRFYFANGDLYVGEWQDDSFHGFGRYYYHHGQRFEGEFIHGQRHGKGKLQMVDGSLNIHRYQNNVRQGTGVRWSADRLSAWKIVEGKSPKSISIAEAVSLVYEIENAVERQTNTAGTSDTLPISLMGTTV